MGRPIDWNNLPVFYTKIIEIWNASQNTEEAVNELHSKTGVLLTKVQLQGRVKTLREHGKNLKRMTTGGYDPNEVQRNKLIIEKFKSGVAVMKIASEFGLHRSRIYQIIEVYGKRYKW